MEDFGHERITVDINMRLLQLRRLMAREMLHEHWDYVGTITGCTDIISKHMELGERHWGGNAYDACVLQILSTIMERCPEKLAEIEEYVKSICTDLEAHQFTNATLVRR